MTEKKIHLLHTEGQSLTSFKGNSSVAILVMYANSVIDEHIIPDDYIAKSVSAQDWPTWICIATYTKFWMFYFSTTMLS
jgi:hypothetical protein